MEIDFFIFNMLLGILLLLLSVSSITSFLQLKLLHGGEQSINM